ncbi:MAG: FAD-binding oxidoreductase [Desulfobacteraceae bacterium]|nr:MAG: FAD-binding oxidoreductase [Desulfobacteraceae bacterium]
MRRWNGWGDETIDFPLAANAYRFLVERIGEGLPLADAALTDVLAKVPESRLPDHPLVTKAPKERVHHARGQSLPDWLALRSGNFGVFPDGVAYPVASEDIRALLTYGRDAGAIIIPYGGGTSVVGHITPEKGENPVLTIDMGRMNRLLSLDTESQIATFGSGTAGPDVEAQLRAQGFTLGHFPQSFEFSTLGGWIATRSSGQQSLRYGRIEKLFAGGRIETPVGTLQIPSFPASAAGPDLREIILGSEGRLGILTEVKVRVTRLPERERFHVMFFPDWQSATDAVRRAVQGNIPLSMLRLSSAVETETQLALAGHERLVAWLEKLLAWRGAGVEKCMVMFGITGTRAQYRTALKQALRVFKGGTGYYIGRYMGRKWIESRFRAPYLRNSLWEKGYAVDTLETATDWENVDHMVDIIESALRGALTHERERIHLFTHLSHLYPQGASIYTTYLFRTSKTYEETVERWQHLKTAASEAIIRNRGTISHQHGVGIDHAPYLAAEKGELGIAAIKALCTQFDPDGIMNPGKLAD